MASERYGSWEPLGISEIVHLFAGSSSRWWISGGHALELHRGRSWRSHDDIDVGVLRGDAPGLATLLDGWDIEVAAGGILSPWDGSTPLAETNQNNLWCRKRSDQPWCLDVTIGDGNREFWMFRRDPHIRFLWAEAILRTERGVPYLAPDLQLLYKSKDIREKDEVDAREVIPHLRSVQRERLHTLLPANHPWQMLMPK
jgi:hypothetical protein